MNRRLELAAQRGSAGELPLILDRDGNEIACNETERRIAAIRRGIESLPDHGITSPIVGDEELDGAIGAIHGAAYLAFIERWSHELAPGEMLLHDHPFIPSGVAPDTPIIAGMYQAARSSAATAIAAAHAILDGASTVYALCRPPGHHAGPSWLGGHCYLNNAALALRTLMRGGIRRVGVIDFDIHFGNGTSAVLERMPGTYFGSIHSSTITSYPYMPTFPPNDAQTFIPFDGDPSPPEFLDALAALVGEALEFGCEALVVSAGYDIIAGDPHGTWSLAPEVLRPAGRIIGAAPVPLCIVQEGGYRPEVLEQCAREFGLGLLGEVPAPAEPIEHETETLR